MDSERKELAAISSSNNNNKGFWRIEKYVNGILLQYSGA